MFFRSLLNDPLGYLTNILMMLPGLLLALSLHEFAHGLAAYKLGDPTAKLQGRLSLNPLHHIDIFGMIMLLFVGFGWAKPVSVDTRYFKKPKRDMAITAIAGPVMNFITAFGVLLIKKIVDVVASACGLYTSIGGSYYGTESTATTIVVIISQMLFMAAVLSVGLGAFNLIPIPPLDGWKVLGAVLPYKTYFKIMQYERFGSILLIVLLVTGILGVPLGIVRDFLMSIFQGGINFVFGIFGL